MVMVLEDGVPRVLEEGWLIVQGLVFKEWERLSDLRVDIGLRGSGVRGGERCV